MSDLDWLAFFRDLYLGFGPDQQLLLRCVRRAYRDFNRTWHGARTSPQGRAVARSGGEDALVKALTSLARGEINQARFDAWHARTRRAVMNATDPTRAASGLTVGQAQKWINMSVKYAVASRVDGFSSVQAFAHVPIDRILLSELSAITRFAPAVALLPPDAWSRLSDDSAYERFQRELRRLAAPNSPLALEFELWLKAKAEGRG